MVPHGAPVRREKRLNQAKFGAQLLESAPRWSPLAPCVASQTAQLSQIQSGGSAVVPHGAPWRAANGSTKPNLEGAPPYAFWAPSAPLPPVGHIFDLGLRMGPTGARISGHGLNPGLAARSRRR